MKLARINELIEIYKDSLFNDNLPFWKAYAKDDLYGGYHHYLDRDGKLLSTDKSVWLNSRQLWTYSYLYNHFEKRNEWLTEAKHCYDFIIKYCLDGDGKMLFSVTYDGKPLKKSDDWLTETFGLIGFAEYSKAANDKNTLMMTRNLFRKVVALYDAPKATGVRPLQAHVEPMLLLSTTQTLRAVDTEHEANYNDVAKRLYSDIVRLFVKKDRKLLLEFVGTNGEIYEDVAQGRTVNVGHAIEEAWFMIVEGMYQNDSKMISDSIELLDWMLDFGWDKEFGGFYSFLDMNGKPPYEFIWDSKLWWPHNEAMYALLLAHHLTGESKYEQWYEKVHKWAFKYFKDDEYGEWYGYLHRDGSVLLPIKGSEWKGSFHTSRMFMYGLELLEKMKLQQK